MIKFRENSKKTADSQYSLDTPILFFFDLKIFLVILLVCMSSVIYQIIKFPNTVEQTRQIKEWTCVSTKPCLLKIYLSYQEVLELTPNQPIQLVIDDKYEIRGRIVKINDSKSTNRSSIDVELKIKNKEQEKVKKILQRNTTYDQCITCIYEIKK